MPDEPIYASAFCRVDTYTPRGDGARSWYIGAEHESYQCPEWPTKEAMITDLERVLEALRDA